MVPAVRPACHESSLPDQWEALPAEWMVILVVRPRENYVVPVRVSSCPLDYLGGTAAEENPGLSREYRTCGAVCHCPLRLDKCVA
ncbi:unnamed protein product [Soboliphyme baturini]|uniref:Uncharacterized protein n=1 Tax=Soboliphyme baturini TaxID=241478 RepID=A0A183J124_9BILA|nr:unnamed protein product [Soboliphyme baturini]